MANARDIAAEVRVYTAILALLVLPRIWPAGAVHPMMLATVSRCSFNFQWQASSFIDV